MRRYIIACAVLLLAALGLTYAFYVEGVYLGGHSGEVSTFVRQEGKSIYLDRGSGYEEFEIRGVNLGVGIPGHFATDYAIDKQTYLRWFDDIKQMGANTIRVYILQGPAFYEALHEYNTDNPDPLYVLHGVWIEDYVQNSHMSAYDPEYLDRFIDDTVTMIDVIHGNKMLELGDLSGSGSYTWDVSPWVIGYILGVEWEAPTVAYTDAECGDQASYQGEYLSTTADASPFEAMLARVGDRAFQYESERYGEQRLVAFSNWATTDPFDYTGGIESYFDKYESVDVEHIVLSDKVLSGTFASYHVYPYYPDYLRHIEEYWSQTDPHGNVNTYYTYLRLLNEHHTVPVVIAEFGVSTGRGMAQVDANTGRNQGNMSESEQGEALVQCYRDIREAGCAGSILFSWQDEWFKRTWNTMAYVDLLKTPYWSDAQTNEQYFGLLAFDPGEERSACYVDGDDEEWSADDVIGAADGRELSVKYDEKYVYLMVRGEDVGEGKRLYLPIDTTQKSGSTTCADPALSFDRAADFLVVLDGREGSRVLVQARYSAFRAMFLRSATGEDPYVNPPERDSPEFVPIQLLLQNLSDYTAVEAADGAQFVDGDYYYLSYETGALRYGDGNPAHEGFDSLADFCYGDGLVEIRLPWQLLNFGNPSEMQIHDDYYEHWGVEFTGIERMYVGVGDGSDTISLLEQPLEGWGTHVTYHERLKESYFIMQQLWGEDVSADALLADGSPELAEARERARAQAGERLGDAA